MWSSYYSQCLSPILERRYENRECASKLLQKLERRHGLAFSDKQAKATALIIVKGAFAHRLSKQSEQSKIWQEKIAPFGGDTKKVAAKLPDFP